MSYFIATVDKSMALVKLKLKENALEWEFANAEDLTESDTIRVFDNKEVALEVGKILSVLTQLDLSIGEINI